MTSSGSRSSTCCGSTPTTRSPRGASARTTLDGRRRAADRAALRRAALRRPGHGPDGRPAAELVVDGRALRDDRRHRAHAEPADRGGLHDARPGARRRPRPVDEAARARTARSSAASRSLRGRPRGADRRRGERARSCARYAERDEGACRLGEVALVDGEGRIGPLDTVFYDTLLDENAACHIALGSAYLFTVDDEADRGRANDSADPRRLHDRRPRRRRHRRHRAAATRPRPARRGAGRSERLPFRVASRRGAGAVERARLEIV